MSKKHGNRIVQMPSRQVTTFQKEPSSPNNEESLVEGDRGKVEDGGENSLTGEEER